ncbi:glycosyltransferase [Leucobacter chromiireducens]|uniref:glycosyltransferase n=1 Tax=Leucobacter chromiireducens TaxID=283877 RepID=UPI000F64496C|nr:glycosyltransferase [Leucobacter chromiireducens]
MRYVLAIATLALSGVLLILGLGQRTFLAGPAEISFPVDTKSETAYAVIDGADFAKVPGQANVVVQGEHAFVATGATRDVRGWVEPFSHAELSVDTSGKKLLSALIAPAIDTAPADAAASESAADAEAPSAGLDPRGSDLWLEERVIDEAGTGTETETLRVPVSLAADQSVLIASDGTQPVPKDVSLVWAQDRNTPWAGPLLAAGGVLAIVGGLLYLLAVDHDRRGLGPRRGRKGPLQGIRNAFSRGGRGTESAPQTQTPSQPQDEPAAQDQGAPKDGSAAPDTAPAQRTARPSGRTPALRRAALPALGLTVALGLSGCSASYWPQFDAAAEVDETPAPTASAVAPVPVTEGQLDRIVQRVSETAGLSDDELDATLLAERFTGDALAQRAANYKIRAKQPDYAVLPPRITDEELDYQLVQSTEGWPRTLFVTVASTAGGDSADAAGAADEASDAPASPSLALVLTQQTAHENYLVSRVIALRGGISMPQAAPAEDGTALLSNDIETLMLAPGKVGEAYAALLQNGKDAEQAELFDLETDTLLDSYGKARAAEAQAASDDKGQTMRFSVQAKQGDAKPVALSTGAGGALVATTVIEEQIVDADGGRYKPQAKDAVTALSGLSGEQDKLIQEVAHQMLFFVPSKTAGTKIELLGVTSELVGVRN